MSVTKDTCERYTVRTSGERATITLICWDNPPLAGSARTDMHYGGEIVIHSTFGTWGYTWTACGVPFKRFLVDLEFDYVFTKFMGHKLNRFDGEASMRQMFSRIASQRRDGSLDKAEAREVWDLLIEEEENASKGEYEFGTAMMNVAENLRQNHPMRCDFADPCGWPHITHYDYQARGFWEQLWPLFTEAIQGEIEASTPTRRPA